MQNNLDRQYLELMQDILENGTVKKDRTGTGTISITGASIRHDMAEGFPSVTSKKLFFKAMSVELEGFLKGITDKSWFKERGCNIWNQWHSPIHKNFLDQDDDKFALDDNDLGPIYGAQWNKTNKPIKTIPTIHTNFDKEVKLSDDNDSFIGYICDGKYGKYIVEKLIEQGSKCNSKIYQVVFTKTGYRTNQRKDVIKKGNVKDFYYPNIQNVAALGNYSNDIFGTEITESLKKHWRGFINRCYNLNDNIHQKYYENIWVNNKWLVFEYFLEDVSKMKNFDLKIKDLKNYTIERINNKGNYSLENCMWLHKKYQVQNRSNSLFFNAYKDGDLIWDNIFIADLENKLNRKQHTIRRYADKKILDGYNIQSITRESKPDNEGISQLDELLDSLKDSPHSRRMLVSAWNHADRKSMALLPCHVLFQVIARGDKLDLVFYMRSVDVCLGMPFDIASFGLLLTLLCKQFNMIPGELIGFFADTHIYLNHVKTAKEQIERNTHILPTLSIDKSFTDVKNFDHKMAKLENYVSEDKLTYKIAI